MTFEELEHALPNGFHDARMRRIALDFCGPVVSMDMDLLVGLPNTPDPETYRPGTVKVASASLFIAEAPDLTYPFALTGAAVSASGWVVTRGAAEKIEPWLARLPKETTAIGLFLDEWNSYIYIAGASVEFSWDDEVSLG